MMIRVVFRYPTTSIREVYVSEMPAILRNGLAFRLGQQLPDNGGCLWVEDVDSLKWGEVSGRQGPVRKVEIKADSDYGSLEIAKQIASWHKEIVALHESWGCC